MAQTADDNGVGKLVGQLVDFNDGDFVLTVPQKDRTACNLNGLLVQGSVSFTALLQNVTTHELLLALR